MQPLTRTRSSTVGNDGQILHQAREKLEEQRKLQVALKECAKTLRQADSYISKLTKERKNKSGEDFLRLSQMLIAAHQSKDEIKEKCSQQVISLTEQLESMKLTDDEERVQRGHEAMLTAAARKSTAGSIDESQIVTFIDVREKIITQLEKCTEPRERHRFENALSRINADLAMIEKQRRKSSSKPTLSIDTSDTRNPYDALQTAKLKDSVEVQLRLCPEKYEKYHHLCKKTDLEHKVLLDMYSRRQVTRNYKIRPIGASTPTTWKVRCLNHRIKLLKKVWSGQATTDDIIWDRGRRKDADDNITDALRILTPHAQRAATALEELAAEMKLAAEVCYCYSFPFKEERTNSENTKQTVQLSSNRKTKSDRRSE